MLLHIPANFFADLHVLSHRAGQKGVERLHVLSHACGEGHRARASPCGYQHALPGGTSGPRGAASAAGEALHPQEVLLSGSSRSPAALARSPCARPARAAAPRCLTLGGAVSAHAGALAHRLQTLHGLLQPLHQPLHACSVHDLQAHNAFASSSSRRAACPAFVGCLLPALPAPHEIPPGPEPR